VRFSANFARKRERWSEAMREHEAILDALRRRAASELSDILFQHLRNKARRPSPISPRKAQASRRRRPVLKLPTRFAFKIKLSNDINEFEVPPRKNDEAAE